MDHDVNLMWVDEQLYAFPDDHYRGHTDKVTERLDDKGYLPAKSRVRQAEDALWAHKRLQSQTELEQMKKRWALTDPDYYARVPPTTNTRSNMTNADIVYTDKFEPRSSAIEDVYYNSKTAELFVATASGYTYRYDNVPTGVYTYFKSAFSKGRFYNREIKKKYGPGENIGINDRLYAEEYSVPAPDMSATPTANFNVADTGKVTVTNPGPWTHTVGTPKGLDYADDAIVTDEPSEAPEQAKVYSLDRGPVNLPETRKHVVRFTNGGEKLLERTVKVASVDEAVADVEAIAEMLDEDFSIKSVEVYFA